MQSNRRAARQGGAILATFCISLLVLLLFCGLAIDVGYLYMTRAALSKGADSAALMAVRSLGLPQNVTTAIAQSTFTMNYEASGLAKGQAADPTVDVTYPSDPDTGDLQINVHASVPMKTFFLGLLPGRDIIAVASAAQASRARLIMGIALDRSGSMVDNKGAMALPPAVSTFIDLFNENYDRVALTSYASHSTIDVPMTKVFKALVKNRLKTMVFSGTTYSHGGIDMARAQINAAPIIPGENAFRVMVFFTDGHANSFLGNYAAGDVTCTSPGAKRLLIYAQSGNSDAFRDPNTGAQVACNSNYVKLFHAYEGGTRSRTTFNVTAEGLFMAERSAALTRGDGTLIFAIGLGNDIDKVSLQKMANDPASPTYDPKQPAGVAVFAPTAADLDDVFRQIAARILLRLTR
jgi:Flp pilus assembly protein TadG